MFRHEILIFYSKILGILGCRAGGSMVAPDLSVSQDALLGSRGYHDGGYWINAARCAVGAAFMVPLLTARRRRAV